jgi:hypothetical protein
MEKDLPATYWPLDLQVAFSESPRPIDFVLPGLPVGCVGALVSPGGAGKSMLALQLAIQIAGGPDWLELGKLERGSVLYLPAEDPRPVLHHRLFALGGYLDAFFAPLNVSHGCQERSTSSLYLLECFLEFRNCLLQSVL